MSGNRMSRTGLAAACATALTLGLVSPATAAVVAEPVKDLADGATADISVLGSYGAGAFDESAAEIVAFHADSKRILTVNALSGKIDVLDAADPAKPTKVGEVSGGENTTINSVAVRNDGLAVAAVEPENKTDAGELIFFDAGAEKPGAVLGRVGVGSLPDMVTITPEGDYALVANEGEPAEDYSVDPEGSVSVVKLPASVKAATQADVRTADFRAFEGTLADKGVHIYGQVGASTTEAQNLEPEYIAVAGGKAYVTLQENNAVAVVDIASATVEDVWPLGYTDRREVPMDISDKDGKINIRTAPVKGILQPDSIAAYEVDGTTYLVTANEGDARDWEAYSEEERIKKLGGKKLAPICEGYAGMTADEIEEFQADENAGRLKITTAFGLNEEKNCYEDLYTYGGRSFSIFTADGTRVFDSGAEFEELTAKLLPEYFNTNHTENEFESRSDDKGPEPEGVALGEINGRTYAFVGFERLGGVIVYDITDPAKPAYTAYINNRDFSINMEELADEGDDAVKAGLEKVGDLGAEGLAFVPAKDSPNGENLLIVGNEVSGTTTVFQVDSLIEAPAEPAQPGTNGEGSSLSKGGVIAIALAAVALVMGALGALGNVVNSMFAK
ncbi:choice-of-anchor I family protein [Corynebacterium lehmanniae]|nr:choice-of-anchor I family protein [Corynebacterium lehmanniae]